MKTFVALAASSILLIQANAAQAQTTAVPHACPASVRVVASNGRTYDYLGAVSGIPDLCHMRRTGEDDGDYYFGAWRTDWPGAGQAYPALWTVFHGPKGTRASFVTRSFPGLQWLDSLENQGVEAVLVGGVARSALRVAHERAGIEGNTYHSIITDWIDLATGAIIRADLQQIAGQSYGQGTTWHAVRLETEPLGRDRTP